jgi:HJR/Mrr/RecB family endonuclease
MSLDINSITPSNLEKAKADLDRAYQAWTLRGAVRVPPDALIELDKEVHRLVGLLNEARSHFPSLEQERAEASEKLKYLRRCLWKWELWTSQNCSYWIGGIGGFVTLLLASIPADISGAILVAFIGCCLSILAICVLMYLRDSDWADDKITALERLIARTQCRLQHATTRLDECKACRDQYEKGLADANTKYQDLLYLTTLCNDYDQAQRNHDQLQGLLKSRRYQLLQVNWRDLRGIAFEEFIQQVLEALGYAVKTTPVSGDQGTDLIATLDGKRIAIQAKGQRESVGNHAVMEVNAGRYHYGCDCCVVITNSDFTRLARELAKSNGCMLLSGNELPALIIGNVDL